LGTGIIHTILRIFLELKLNKDLVNAKFNKLRASYSLGERFYERN